MDSQYSTAAIDELMSVVRQVQRKTAARTGNPLFVAIHFAFGGVAVVAFAVVVLCRLAGHQIGDELTDKYVFSLATSVLFFAVGTLMIERLQGDMFGGFLGRALALCGLFVMSAQGYEFMQKTRACEVQHELLAKGKPVSDATFVALRSVQLSDGRLIEWETHEDGRRTSLPAFRRRGTSGNFGLRAGRSGSASEDDGRSGSGYTLPRGASGTAASTNGNDETF